VTAKAVMLNNPTRAGGVEYLVGDTRPQLGVELVVGAPGVETDDLIAWLTPEEALALALALQLAARNVAEDQALLRKQGTFFEGGER
jgi:hypothetical protein